MDKRKTLEFIKSVLFVFAVMVLCFILMDFYVPIKRVIIGELSLSDFPFNIDIKRYLPIAFAVSIALGIERIRKNTKK